MRPPLYGGCRLYARPALYAPDRLRRQLVFGSVVTLSTAALVGCGDQATLEGLSVGRTGRVTGVISGDSFEIDGGETIKLAGVEAPRASDSYGAEATDVLAGLIEGARVVLLHGGARQDPFGRTVAHVRTTSGGRWVQGALLDRGATRVRTYPDNRALARSMLAREASARTGRRGLWALADYTVLLPEEVTGQERGLQLVEGRVERVGRSASSIYFDFSREWRNGLSAEIPRGALSDFRSAKVDPIDLEGRMVRIRGAIHGRRMILDHPEQIELLRG